MRLLDKLRNKQQFKYGSVTVPEWGETVRLREWDSIARAALIADRTKENLTQYDLVELSCKIVVASVVDDDDKPAFTADDVDYLMHCNAKAVECVARAALKHNGLTVEVDEEIKQDFTQAPLSD